MTMLTGLVARNVSTPILLAFAGAILALSTFLMLHITKLIDGLLAFILFGMALGIILPLLPVAWADFFGRKNYGSIRGISLAVQVAAQAVGPIISGIMWDLTGDYVLSLKTFTVLSLFSVLFALSARPPQSNSTYPSA